MGNHFSIETRARWVRTQIEVLFKAVFSSVDSQEPFLGGWNWGQRSISLENTPCAWPPVEGSSPGRRDVRGDSSQTFILGAHRGERTQLVNGGRNQHPLWSPAQHTSYSPRGRFEGFLRRTFHVSAA